MKVTKTEPMVAVGGMSRQNAIPLSQAMRLAEDMRVRMADMIPSPKAKALDPAAIWAGIHKRDATAAKTAGPKVQTLGKAPAAETDDLSDLIPAPKSHAEIWAIFNSVGKNRKVTN